MTKLRTNEIAAYCLEFAFHGEYTGDPSRQIIFALPGGCYTEHNSEALIENMKRMFPGNETWRCKVLYRWRSKRHLLRWRDRGGTFLRESGVNHLTARRV